MYSVGKTSGFLRSGALGVNRGYMLAHCGGWMVNFSSFQYTNSFDGNGGWGSNELETMSLILFSLESFPEIFISTVLFFPQVRPVSWLKILALFQPIARTNIA